MAKCASTSSATRRPPRGIPTSSVRSLAHGREEARLLAEQLAAEQPDAVVTSPLLRARETAEALARACGLEAVPDERLAPGATSLDARHAAADRGERVVLVGHQPDLGRIAAALTGGEEPPFPTAGMAVIDLP